MKREGGKAVGGMFRAVCLNSGALSLSPVNDEQNAV